MKTLITLSFILLGMHLFSGCEKHKDCYECTTVIYSVQENKMILCDVTEEEVEWFEQANSGNSSETKCVKE